MNTPPTKRTLGRWLLSFAGFPLGGLAAELALGGVDSPISALAGGALTGFILGGAQWLALGPNRPDAKKWIAATTVGLSVGLAVGASVVGFETQLSDLALQGLISGLAVGVAQAAVLRPLTRRIAFLWPAFLAAAWCLGWMITTSVGVDVERQYTVFGASGALTVALLSSVLPLTLHRAAAK